MPSTADNPITVSDLRKELKEVLRRARRGSRFTIRQNSDEVAVLVGIAEWRLINETLDVLLDKGIVSQIIASEKAIARGDTRPASEVLNEIEGKPGATPRKRRKAA